MAEVVLSPLLQVCFDKLADPLLKSFSMICNMEKEMDELKSTLTMIRVVLEDAEEQQVRNKLVNIWLENLKEVAYDADDVLEEFILNRIEHQNNESYEGLGVCSMPFDLMTNSYKSLCKLKKIQNKFDAVMSEKYKFHFRELGSSQGVDTLKRKQTGSFTIESKVYGRVEDKEKLVNLLIQDDIASLSVIPIVGIGGLGKTTLARLAYNDYRVDLRFELKMWVSVTDEFDVVSIIKSIIESATKTKCDSLAMDALQSKLWELLNGKRYLLVLDDVWNEDQDEWDELKCLLRGGGTGSKIIVTTRSKKVCAIMGTVARYDLHVLSDEDCWGLFKERAFATGEEDEHPNLLNIGKQILRKCGGVPLAAKTMGSVMRFKREEREWLAVQESDIWNVCEGRHGILPALRLTYSHLPTYLKPCFAYCSIFPKSYNIKKEHLIHQWIAQGFVKPPASRTGLEAMRTRLEDIGNEYFNVLLGMSFFQDPEKFGDGMLAECKMHDVIHDLARSVAGDEFMLLEPGHVADLRSLILSSPRSDFREAPGKILSSFPYLRVLSLSGCGIESLPSSIQNLRCLRYLDLSCTFIGRLPEDISKLFMLQHLNLLDCYNLTALPMNLRLMKRLRHLNITGCDSLTWMPVLLGTLHELQTLPIFMVGEESARGLLQLAQLNLHGELEIKHLENVKKAPEASIANLKGKRHIDVLGLSWGNGGWNLDVKRENRAESHLFRMLNKRTTSVEPSTWASSDTRSRDTVEDVIEHLEPNSNLKRLLINGYDGRRFPVWLSGIQLPNLLEVVLINCNRCELLPTLGQLPFLKVLYMHGLFSVKCIHIGFYGSNHCRSFPSLKELSVKDFQNLEEWLCIDMKELFPCLVKLTINNCPMLRTIPCPPSLQYLELRKCNSWTLRAAVNLTTLHTLVVDVMPELLALPDGLLENNPNLTALTISSCPDLQSLPSGLGKLIALKSLTIRWCEKLAPFPKELCNLVSLESLEIIECPNITSLSEEGMEGLNCLRTLSIENCDNLTSLPIGSQSLASLENLVIMYCPKLASFPEDMRVLTSLRRLSILNCPELVLLPEGIKHITSLQNLEIRGCPGLTNIPEEIANLTSLRSLAISDCHNLAALPEGVKHLYALQHLSIQECPNLERRCHAGRGEDWQKIAHIPHIYIGLPIQNIRSRSSR